MSNPELTRTKIDESGAVFAGPAAAGTACLPQDHQSTDQINKAFSDDHIFETCL